MDEAVSIYARRLIYVDCQANNLPNGKSTVAAVRGRRERQRTAHTHTHSYGTIRMTMVIVVITMLIIIIRMIITIMK